MTNKDFFQALDELEENIEKLKNILNLLNYKFSKIGYSQGMNNLV